MSERSHAYAVRSAMTKTPRTPPSSTGAPRPPAAEPSAEGAGEVSGEAAAPSNPFASFGSPLGEPGGETKLYEVPRELIEIARAKAAEPAASTGTLTPIAPRPNAELEATLAAYTSGLAGTTSSRLPSSQPERPGRQEVETLRSQPGAYEESGTVLRRDVVPDTQPRAGERANSAPRPAPLERKPLLRSPVAPRPAAPRSTPAHAGPAAGTARGRPWLFYLGLCVILGYCAHLLLRS